MPPIPRPTVVPRPLVVALCLALLGGVAVAGCGDGAAGADAGGRIVAVGAENEYADVIEQIGGRYVEVSAVESDPNTDPHSFEASVGIARRVADADLVVQNGLGYDSFMEKIEAASPSDSRRVIDMGELLGLPASTPNPHLWYQPRTMPALARRLAADFAALRPRRRGYFDANLKRFEASLRPWRARLARLSTRFPDAAVATTEPVADYLLEAAGIENLTPFAMQADLMNDVDPAPQAVALQERLFTDKQADAFVYNRQVTDSIGEKFLRSAADNGVPVVGVYETMPDGYTYQGWMEAETAALEAALARGKSTGSL